MAAMREQRDNGDLSYGDWRSIPSGFASELIGLRAASTGSASTCSTGCSATSRLRPGRGSLHHQDPTFVATQGKQPGQIMKAFDSGARGIVSMINNAEVARPSLAA